MVNFFNNFVSCSDSATLPQVAGKWVGPHSGQVREGLAWDSHLLLSTDHLDHIKKVAGAGAVGLGGDFDGVTM